MQKMKKREKEVEQGMELKRFSDTNSQEPEEIDLVDTPEEEIEEISAAVRKKFPLTSIIYHIVEPSVIGLSANSYMEAAYAVARSQPGSGENLNSTFLIFTMTVPLFLATLKILANITNNPILRKIIHYIEAGDTGPSSFVFILQFVGASVFFVGTQLHDNEYVEVDVSDGGIIGIFLSVAFLSSLLLANSLGFYRWFEKTFALKNWVSGAASSIELWVTVNAIGRLLIDISSFLFLIRVENPLVWCVLIAISLGLSFGVAALGGYTSYRSHPWSFLANLGNREQREYIVEAIRRIGTSIAIFGNYGITLYEIAHNPELPTVEKGLLIGSVLSTGLLLLPVLLVFGIVISYLVYLLGSVFCSSKPSPSSFQPHLTQPLLESVDVVVISHDSASTKDAPQREEDNPGWKKYLPSCDSLSWPFWKSNESQSPAATTVNTRASHYKLAT
jgi:hypothetical protein